MSTDNGLKKYFQGCIGKKCTNCFVEIKAYDVAEILVDNQLNLKKISKDGSGPKCYDCLKFEVDDNSAVLWDDIPEIDEVNDIDF